MIKKICDGDGETMIDFAEVSLTQAFRFEPNDEIQRFLLSESNNAQRIFGSLRNACHSEHWSEKMAKMEKGWDGYNADPPTLEAISLAKRIETIATEFGLDPMFRPSAVGGVGITFNLAYKSVFLEIKNTGMLSGLKGVKGKRPDYFSKDPLQLREVVEEIFEYGSIDLPEFNPLSFAN